MTGENLALIERLEKHPELPLNERRGTMHVLSRNRMYMNDDVLRRYEALADGMRRELVAMFCPGQS